MSSFSSTWLVYNINPYAIHDKHINCIYHYKKEFSRLCHDMSYKTKHICAYTIHTTQAHNRKGRNDITIFLCLTLLICE